jgi:integrase
VPSLPLGGPGSGRTDGGLARRTISAYVFLADEEETRLREAIGEDPWPLVAVAIHTGLRQGEQFHLRWEHVDFATGILTVPRSKHGGARRVPMNDTVRGRPSGPGPCRAV